MSVDKHFEKQGIEIAPDNSLPPGQRTQKVFKRVVAAIRAAEAESNDELRRANEQARDAQQKVILLQDRVRVLENELLKHKLEAGLKDHEALTTADKKRLLECAS